MKCKRGCPVVTVDGTHVHAIITRLHKNGARLSDHRWSLDVEWLQNDDRLPTATQWPSVKRHRRRGSLAALRALLPAAAIVFVRLPAIQ